MGGVLSTRPIETAMSCSLTYAFSRMSLSRRVPSFFCCSSNCSTWRAVGRPSSTRASAIRSPNVFTGGMLTENFAQIFYEVRRWDQIPKQPIWGSLSQLLRGLLIEWIGRRDKDRLAHPVERQDAPALASIRRETPRELHVNVVGVERNEGKTRFVGKDFQRLLDRYDSLVGEDLNKRFDDAFGRTREIGRIPAEIEVARGNDFAFDKNLVHRFAAIFEFYIGGLARRFLSFIRGRLGIERGVLRCGFHGEAVRLAFNLLQRGLDVRVVGITL